MERAVPAGRVLRRSPTEATDWAYWFALPVHWARQVVRNGHDILRVIDLLKLRPIGSGLVDRAHPWVTGSDPSDGTPIWTRNVVFRTPRDPRFDDLPDDETIVVTTGRFLAHRVRHSATEEEIPQGPKRRMPHAINYMHGSSHYNSGILLFNDLQEGYRYLTDPRFRRELVRFVRAERREVLIVFRDRHYEPVDYACFSCCVRSRFPWFCNPNGPQGRVLWGNFAPFPAANLITGHWADDVYALKRADGKQRVVRPAIEPGRYFAAPDYGAGRSGPRWPEVLLAWATYWRVRVRGPKGGLYFVDRTKVYADALKSRVSRGKSIVPQSELRFARPEGRERPPSADRSRKTPDR